MGDISRRNPDERSEIRERPAGLNACPGFRCAHPGYLLLREAKRGSYDLVMLGVTRRPGDTLFFGNMAAALLERCDTAILFVAS